MLFEHAVARALHRAALAPALADVLLLLDRDAPARRRRRRRRVRVVVLAARGVVRGARAAVLHDVVHRDPLALLDVRVADPERQLLELALVDAVVRRVLAHLLGDVPDLAHRDLAHLARDVRQVLTDHLGEAERGSEMRRRARRRGAKKSAPSLCVACRPCPCRASLVRAHRARRSSKRAEEAAWCGFLAHSSGELVGPKSGPVLCVSGECGRAAGLGSGVESGVMSLNRAMGRAWATVCKSYQASVAKSLTPYGACTRPPACRAFRTVRRRTAVGRDWFPRFV